MAVRLVVRHPRSRAGEPGEIRFEFDQPRVVLGRSPGVEVQLPSSSVSETHAFIELSGGHYTLRDAGSTNGTRLNDKPLIAGRATTLEAGDLIEIAEFSIAFSDEPLQRRPTLPERTASLARRMLGELLGKEADAEPPFVRITEGPETGTVLNFGEPPASVTVGRGDDCDLPLSDVDVSRAHIELARDVDGVFARDLNSKNGLDVNGRRVRERRLKHGDLVRIGATTLLYQDPAEHALRLLEKQPDQPFTRTTEVARPVEPPSEREPTEEPLPLEVESTRPAGPVDLLIYALAVFVLVASAVGLVWLLR